MDIEENEPNWKLLFQLSEVENKDLNLQVKMALQMLQKLEDHFGLEKITNILGSADDYGSH